MLHTPWTSYSIFLILNALICFIIAFLLVRKQFVAGQFTMILVLVTLAFWEFGYAMILVSESLEVKRFWLRVEVIGIITNPLLWFIFALQYSTQNKKTYTWLIAVLSIVPAISLIFIFSDRWFHYYYTNISLLFPNGGPLKIERGFMYWIAFVELYVLELIAVGMLVRHFIVYRNIYRRQMALLLLATLIPMLANIYFQVAPRLSLPPYLYTNLDVTPISFALSAVLFSAAIFRLKLFDLIPIARHRVLEYIPQMVFTLDVKDHVLDINDTGQKWLGKSAEQLIGRSALDVFSQWSDLINRFQSKLEAREEIFVEGDASRTLDVTIFPVYNRNKLEGRVFVAHDISDRIDLENNLKIRLAEIQALHEELEEQATRDPLTGLYNRRFLAEAFDREISRAKREEKPISIVILDMDYFKKFNDSYGHKCGDEVLIFIAQFLTENVRHEDVACRYGGEEFVVLMPNATLESAYERVENWRKIFQSNVFEYEELKLRATFSAGIASFPLHGENGESVLQAADKALYHSKNNGRNLVTIYNNKI